MKSSKKIWTIRFLATGRNFDELFEGVNIGKVGIRPDIAKVTMRRAGVRMQIPQWTNVHAGAYGILQLSELNFSVFVLYF